MKLIDLLVKELPKRGGWPCGVDAVEQDSEGQLFEMESDYCSDFKLEKCDDWIADVVTKQQYESALASSDGWIEWNGGECPVDSDAIVEVKFRIPKPYQYNNYNDRAGDFDWDHIGSNADIIAYRLHKPDAKSRANDDRMEQDLNECIGQDVVTEWDGEGLPPVGVECEYSLNSGRTWFKCKIDYILGTQGLVMLADVFEGGQWVSFHEYDGKLKFRPLRTESERKRDAAINDMLTIIDCNGVDPKNSAIQIYDAIAAGKIPGIKLEAK